MGNLRLKIIFGYILTTLLTLVAAWYIYNNVIQVVLQSDDQSNPAFEKSTLISVAVSSLYEVDYYGNRLMQSYNKSNLNDYRTAIRALNSNIDTLQKIISSEAQLVMLDEIRGLIKRKERNIKEITSLYQKYTSDIFFQESFDKVIEEAPKDTVIRQSFFRRVGKAFKRTEKMDTVSDRSRLVSAIEVVKSDVAQKQAQSNTIINSKLQALVKTEQMISGQISLLINDLNMEAVESSFQEINSRRALLHDSGRVIIIVAVVALGVIILFLWIVLMDLNKSQRYKRELEVARKHAEELMRSRQRLLFNISHDIKAPLSSITGYLDLMTQTEYAQNMKLSVNHIMDLLSNLLEYAKMDTGKAVVNKTLFNIDDMVGHIHKIFIPLAAEKGISLTVTRSVKGVELIESDAVRIRQIIMNLLSNAVKFTDRGEVVLSYEVTYDQLHISVSDSGCGIEQSKQSIIFEEFTRVEQGREGTGLGLTVVANAVELLDGIISLNSHLGQGSTFNVTLPVVRSFRQEEVIFSRNLTILIIDDDKLQLKMCDEMLRKIGHRVLVANSLDELMGYMVQDDVDLVLTDLNMGRISGYDVVKAIRERGSFVPIIAVSANEMVEVDDFCGYLKKPFTLNELKQVIGVKMDLSSLQEMMDGDKVAIDEIVGLFIQSTKDNCKSIEEHYERGEYTEIKKLSHKMLPMFRQFKIEEVASMLSEIDQSEIPNDKTIQKLIYRLNCFNLL